MTHATDSIITASGDKSQYVPPPISGACRPREQRRGEPAIVDSVIRGEYDDAPTHAVGSSGAWPVLEYAERVTPYRLTDAGTTALHEAGS